MKNSTLKNCFLGISIIFFTQCNSYTQAELSLEDCYNNRKVTDTITNENAEIQKIADTYCIVLKDLNKRYTACNLPEPFKKEKIRIVFSGVVKEIFPNERWVATPFLLTEIKSVN